IHSGIRIAEEPSEPVEGLPVSYLLFVSTIEPRKNLDALISALEILDRRGTWDGSLVIAGRIGWNAGGTVSRMRTTGCSGRILHLHYLARPNLVHLYRHAEIFVLPSFYEGFGFPLLEAMSFGVPCIAAGTSSLPEVGGDAALYIDPHDPGTIADAVERLAGDPGLRRTLGEKGRARAAEFRWQQTAAETLGVFRRVAGKS
ncbi:MAG TPA: glycosyltransferase family 1 protein, partial [Thermoanaerobaculia bacterium]|nr:glycosyltransferase family 1 protein [Thermoanaerobaculia bacterium]